MKKELNHYGVLGMKWGVRHDKERSTTRKKKHLGLDDKGHVNFISEKTSAKGKKLFAIRSMISIGGVAVTIFLAKHPNAIHKGTKLVDKFIKKNGAVPIKEMPVDSGIYSKTLGRMLTVSEAIERGFY